MAKIVVKLTKPEKVKLRTIHEVLGMVDTGASPTGSTFYKTLFTCPREFALWQYAKIKPERLTEALATGWLWHYCLETYYGAIQTWQQACKGKRDDNFYWGGNKAAQRAAYNVVQLLAEEPGYEDVYANTVRMLEAYFELYDGVDRWRIIAVEETLIYRRRGLIYSARLDLIVEDIDRGGMWVIEHKTAKYLSAELMDSYQLDLQILGQVWLLPNTIDVKKYPMFAGVQVNIITKPKKVKPPEVSRPLVMPSHFHLEAFVSSIGSWNRMIKFYADELWPRALGHCSGYSRGYSKCQYYEICHGFPELGVQDWIEAKDLPQGYVRA